MVSPSRFPSLAVITHFPRMTAAHDAVNALPLSHELSSLVERHKSVQQAIQEHRQLIERIDGVMHARQQGNGKMELPVELGQGFTIEGVV